MAGRVLGLSMVLAACSAPSSRSTVATVEPYLGDNGTAQVTRQVRIVRSGSARWTLDAPAIELNEGPVNGAFPPVPVVDETPDQVRVVLDSSAVRAIAWISRSALARVPIRRTAVAPTPDAPMPADDRSATLGPGTVVELHELRQARRHVTSGRTNVQFDGWIDDSVLGDVFIPEPAADLMVDGTVVDGTVVDGTTVVGIPVLPGETAASIPEAGRVIATLAATSVAREFVPAPPGYVAIRWSGPGITVRGLVSASAFTPSAQQTVRLFMDLLGASGGISDTPMATLRAGASFYDRPEGHPVGRVKQATTIYAWEPPRTAEWSRVVLVYVPQLGFVKAYVRRGDISPFIAGGNG